MEHRSDEEMVKELWKETTEWEEKGEGKEVRWEEVKESGRVSALNIYNCCQNRRELNEGVGMIEFSSVANNGLNYIIHSFH